MNKIIHGVLLPELQIETGRMNGWSQCVMQPPTGTAK